MYFYRENKHHIGKNYEFSYPKFIVSFCYMYNKIKNKSYFVLYTAIQIRKNMAKYVNFPKGIYRRNIGDYFRQPYLWVKYR